MLIQSMYQVCVPNEQGVAGTHATQPLDRPGGIKSEMILERHAHEWLGLARTLTYFITKFVGEKVSANEDDGRITDCR